MCVLTLLSDSQTLPLISQSRRLIREGPVTELMDFSLKDTERSVYLHLFNDYLLISLHKEWANVQYSIVAPPSSPLPTFCFHSKPSAFPLNTSQYPVLICPLHSSAFRGGRFTVIDHSPVSELRVENCRVKLHSLQKNLFRVHMSNKALLLRTDALWEPGDMRLLVVI